MKFGKGYKWEVLALLWVAFFLNQADRQVFNVVNTLYQIKFGHKQWRFNFDFYEGSCYRGRRITYYVFGAAGVMVRGII